MSGGSSGDGGVDRADAMSGGSPGSGGTRGRRLLLVEAMTWGSGRWQEDVSMCAGDKVVMGRQQGGVKCGAPAGVAGRNIRRGEAAGDGDDERGK